MFSGGKLELIHDDDDFTGDLQSTRKNLSSIFGVSLPPDQLLQSRQSIAQLKHSDHGIPAELSSQSAPSNLSTQMSPTLKHDPLKYMPLKQDNSGIVHAPLNTATPWQAELTRLVTAYKLVDHENVLQGKVGLAVIKSDAGEMRIILYRSKSDLLCIFSISSNVKVIFKNSYLQFRDDQNNFWSVAFEKGGEMAVLDLITEKMGIDIGTPSVQTSVPRVETNVGSTMEIDSEIKTEKPEDCSSDEKSKVTKNQILSRLAKMGQPLPKLLPSNTDLSDSSDTETKKKPPVKSGLALRKSKVQQAVVIPSTNIRTCEDSGMSSLLVNTNIDKQYMNMLLMENRIQATEIRMNISKVEAKVEKLLDKIDVIQGKSTSKDTNSEIVSNRLEEELLQLQKSNCDLKRKVNQFEVNSTKHDHEALSEFKNLTDLFKIYVKEFELSKNLLSELVGRYHSCGNSLIPVGIAMEEDVIRIKTLEHKKEKLEQENRELESKIRELEFQLESMEKANSKEDISVDGLVKVIMNKLYQALASNFEDSQMYSSDYILRTCARVIKEETYRVIKERK